MREPDLHAVAEETWLWLADRYQFVDLDAFVVMPNHLHGIVIIGDGCSRGGSRTAPTDRPKSKPLGRLVGAFKTVSAKRINEMRGTPGSPVWQRNYYEHIIRNETELAEIRQYILENPLRWDDDPENLEVGAVREPPLQ
jgi:putative transposase